MLITPFILLATGLFRYIKGLKRTIAKDTRGVNKQFLYVIIIGANFDGSMFNGELNLNVAVCFKR